MLTAGGARNDRVLELDLLEKSRLSASNDDTRLFFTNPSIVPWLKVSQVTPVIDNHV